jgi:hypothetical protein
MMQSNGDIVSNSVPGAHVVRGGALRRSDVHAFPSEGDGRQIPVRQLLGKAPSMRSVAARAKCGDRTDLRASLFQSVK